MAVERTLRVVAAGDVMLGDSSHFLGRGVGSRIRRHGLDTLLSGVQSRLDGADLFLANLESPLSAVPGGTVWERVYRGDAATAPALRRGRRTVLTLANNHILEHGSALVGETRTVLAAAGIDAVGFGADGGTLDPGLVLEAGGLRVQVLAACLVRDLTRRPVRPEEIRDWLVDRLRAEAADVRIVSLHWGHEFVTLPSPEQVRLAGVLAEAGAHLVIGHHPHVLQPIRRVGGSLVAYSLGNFLFDHDWTDATRTGGLLVADVGRSGVVDWTFEPTTCGRDCRPRPADDGAAARAHAIVGLAADVEPGTYAQARQRAERHHRLRMKLELLARLPAVSRDTWRFLATKRRRPSPRLTGGGGPD